MRNLYTLPTAQHSRLYQIKSNNRFDITSNNTEYTENYGCGTQNMFIYITSDVLIKNGDWCLPFYNSAIDTVTDRNEIYKVVNNDFYYEDKKIILTTDAVLIRNGVQAIDDEFLEWFVKNQKCVYVEVEKIPTSKIFIERLGIKEFYMSYKIIIPSKVDTLELVQIITKEEPKQERKDCHCKEPIFDLMNGVCKNCGNSIIHLGKRISTVDNDKQETQGYIYPVTLEQMSLDDKLKRLVSKWKQQQIDYENYAEYHKDNEHNNKKFTYKAMVTRDCWKELIKLIDDEK